MDMVHLPLLFITGVYICCLAFLALTPLNLLGSWDKVAHLTASTILCMLIYFTWKSTWHYLYESGESGIRTYRLLYTFIIMIGIAVGSECVQGMFPVRDYLPRFNFVVYQVVGENI
jgi:hypothetical protein